MTRKNKINKTLNNSYDFSGNIKLPDGTDLLEDVQITEKGKTKIVQKAVPLSLVLGNFLTGTTEGINAFKAMSWAIGLAGKDKNLVIDSEDKKLLITVIESSPANNLIKYNILKILKRDE